MKYSDGKILVGEYEICVLAAGIRDLDSRQSPPIPDFHTFGALVSADLYYSGVTFSISVSEAAVTVSPDGESFILNTTVRKSLPKKPDPVLVARLFVGGYVRLVRSGYLRARLILRYTSEQSGKAEDFCYPVSAEELYNAVCGYLSPLLFRAEYLRERRKVTLPATAKGCRFPFSSVREGQGELMSAVYRSVKSGKRLFAQAPTGIGKTVSTLYPAIRALAEGKCERIFYLTAKASTGEEAFSAARRLFSSGATFRACAITAKEKVCANQAAASSGALSSFCNPDECPYAKGYYERLPYAVSELISSRAGYTQEVIAQAAEKHCVCPYELSLDLSEYCDLIVCDYNYAFDPAVYLRRYFEEGIPENDSVFLIDEAHNLPDRVRDMYSCELSKNRIASLCEAARESDSESLLPLVSDLESLLKAFLPLRELCRDSLRQTNEGEMGFYIDHSPLPGLGEQTEAAVVSITRYRNKLRGHELFPRISALLAELKKYLRILNFFDGRFVSYIEIRGGDTRARIFCVDPSKLIGSHLSLARASVLFSATLTPTDYFIALCGGGKDSETLDLPSPFSKDNLCLAAVDSVSVRSDDRDERTYRRISTLIAATVSASAGNYICYFPSYDFLEKTLEVFRRRYPKVKTVVQTRGMSRREREDFLSAFKADRGVLRVGFCVLGGSFSEGVDLPGSRLIGSIVVGTGIPSLSNERNILAEYYEQKEPGSGFDYAYAYPGMNRVLQAAGRVIRREDDRGIVVLIDDRYSEPGYIRMFPAAWENIRFTGDGRSLAEIAKRFAAK